MPEQTQAAGAPRVYIRANDELQALATALIEVMREHKDSGVEFVHWHDAAGELGSTTLERLLSLREDYSFAVFLLRPQDETVLAGDLSRTDVTFELGLCLGAFGPKRTFIVRSDEASGELPTALRGVVAAKFKASAAWANSSQSQKQGAVRGAATAIADTIRRELERTGAEAVPAGAERLHRLGESDWREAFGANVLEYLPGRPAPWTTVFHRSHGLGRITGVMSRAGVTEVAIQFEDGFTGVHRVDDPDLRRTAFRSQPV